MPWVKTETRFFYKLKGKKIRYSAINKKQHKTKATGNNNLKGLHLTPSLQPPDGKKNNKEKQKQCP